MAAKILEINKGSYKTFITLLVLKSLSTKCSQRIADSFFDYTLSSIALVVLALAPATPAEARLASLARLQTCFLT